jgi:D,D-heptose 1,7-bisphosphate phosphatase
LLDIHLLVKHKSNIIKDYFGSGSKFGVDITYHTETNARGTAGAILDITSKLDEQFVVMYGDVFHNVNITKLCEYHVKKESDVTLFLHPNDHPSDSDLVEVDSKNRVIAVHGYPHKAGMWYRNLVNAALYIVKKKSLEECNLENKKPDFAKHLIPYLLEQNFNIFGYISTEYIKDMGTPDRLELVQNDILSGRVSRLSEDNKKIAVFLDRDGVINKEVSYISLPEDLELIEGAANAIRRINKAGLLAVVVTNQPVIARGECTIDGLRIIHNKLETILGRKGAYIDAIYYCPHHPDNGHTGEVKSLKLKCECRKPSPGMLFQASKELNIDLEKSWMIGDTTSDILSGHSAGVNTILVDTGYSGLDGRCLIKPDYSACNINSAVSFILNNGSR